MSSLPEIAHPKRKPYASDLSNAKWEVLKPLLPAPKGFGHERIYSMKINHKIQIPQVRS